MKILRVKYIKGHVNGITITDAKEYEVKDAVGEIRIKHNSALNGGEWLSVEQFELIYKPKFTEDVRTTIEESRGGDNSRPISDLIGSLPKRTRKKRGTSQG